MKKITTALLAVILLIALCSCEMKPSVAVIISGAKINEEIFTYYADKVASRPSDYGLDDGPSVDEIREQTIELCKKYISTNTKFGEMKLSLTAAEKTQIAQSVNDLWIREENHYKKIGVSRQTISKIKTAEAYENAVFAVSYDRGKDDKASEKKLTDFFYNNYVCFRTVCAYFTSGDGKTKMSRQEKNKVIEDFNNIKSRSAGSVDAFVSMAESKGYVSSDSVVISRATAGYPDEFFDKVFSQSNDTVQILEYDECVFAVYKEDIKQKGEGTFSNYRSACITALYSEEYNAETEKIISEYTVEEKKFTVKRIIKKVK